MIEIACRGCGCTDDDGCTPDEGGPCIWIEPDLCSACYRASLAPEDDDFLYGPEHEDALLDSAFELE